jgi:hypothetical protein
MWGNELQHIQDSLGNGLCKLPCTYSHVLLVFEILNSSLDFASIVRCLTAIFVVFSCSSRVAAATRLQVCMSALLGMSRDQKFIRYKIHSNEVYKALLKVNTRIEVNKVNSNRYARDGKISQPEIGS